jgi:DNA-binding transcriptional ArsR family regulator
MEHTDAVAALGALAQDTRLDIYRYLVEVGPEGVPAGKIAAKFDLALPTLSFHLSQLRQVGLIAPRRFSRSLVYSADFDSMNALLAYLTKNCCRGEACGPPAVCAPAIPAKEVTDEAPARTRRRQ